MAQFVCEICGGNELIKQDGNFVCQNCGMKYTAEEAKKMIGASAVPANVTDSKSDKLDNLYQLARRANKDGNDENAAKYYEMIILEDPSSWEASFYTVYFSAQKCKIAEIGTAATKVKNTIVSVLRLIKENVADEKAQSEAYTEITEKVASLGLMLYTAAKSHYDGINWQIKSRFTSQYVGWAHAVAEMMYKMGDGLVEFFGDRSDVKSLCSMVWKSGVGYHYSIYIHVFDKQTHSAVIKSYENKIVEITPNYIRKFAIPKEGEEGTQAKSSGGCYVATAVYGSYDCPEVWTLRRYRDNTLAKTWQGRAFINTYYAKSPTLVKWFGHTEWFKKMWRGKLDKMVSELHEQGVEDTPYEDKKW